MSCKKMPHCVNEKKPFLVSVEGNIGSGKSTMLNFFKKLPDVKLFPEPVNEWCDLDGHNLLQLLYEDPKRWSFQFQSYVQLTRLEILQSNTNCRIKMIERSLQNNRYCFLKLAESTGTLSDAELSVLDAWHDWLDNTMDLNLDLIVYLRTDPEVAYERMRVRNRTEESGTPLQFLSQLHDAYEDWLIHDKFGKHQVPILVVDANKSIEDMRKTYIRLQDKIRGNIVVDGPIEYDNPNIHQKTIEI